MMEQVPRDATYRASVTKAKNGYFFTVIIHSSVGSFEAETFLDESSADRQNRDWQTVALHVLEEKMLSQLRRWMKSHRIEVGFSAQGDAPVESFPTPNRKAA